MRIRSALALVLALLAAPLAHAQWEYVGPGRFETASFATDGTATYLNARIGLNAGSLTYRSDDGGESWTDVTAGLGTNDIARPPFAFDVAARGGLVAVGTTDNAGSRGKKRIYLSSDRGANWTLSRTLEDNQVSSVAVVDASTLVTFYRIANVNARPIVFASTDAGVTWTRQPDTDAFAGSITGERTVCGRRFGLRQPGQWGRSSGLFVSTDAGATWAFQAGRTTGPNASTPIWNDGERLLTLSSLSISSAVLNWTDDGGATWSEKTLDLGASLGGSFAASMRSKGDTLLYTLPGSTVASSSVRYSYDLGDTWQFGDADSTVARAGLNGLECRPRHSLGFRLRASSHRRRARLLLGGCVDVSTDRRDGLSCGLLPNPSDRRCPARPDRQWRLLPLGGRRRDVAVSRIARHQRQPDRVREATTAG